MRRQSPGGSCEEGANCVALCSERPPCRRGNASGFAEAHSAVSSPVFCRVALAFILLVCFFFFFHSLSSLRGKKKKTPPENDREANWANCHEECDGHLYFLFTVDCCSFGVGPTVADKVQKHHNPLFLPCFDLCLLIRFYTCTCIQWFCVLALISHRPVQLKMIKPELFKVARQQLRPEMAANPPCSISKCSILSGELQATVEKTTGMILQPFFSMQPQENYSGIEPPRSY